jgi:hypothetical protein
MKLTKEVLNRLIKEELSNVMNEEMSNAEKLVQLQTQMSGMQENDPRFFDMENELMRLQKLVAADEAAAAAGEKATAMDAGGAFDRSKGVTRYGE